MNFIHGFYQKIKIIFQSEQKQIWLAKNTCDGELVIIKLQYANQNKKTNTRNILHQGKFLQNLQGYMGIPFLYWAGREEGTGIAILIIQRLGKTLEELFVQHEKRFELKTVCQIGINLLKMIHSNHDKGYTHGNLKLTGLQYGVGKKCNQLFFNDLIDSGLYIKKGKHIKQKQYMRKSKINQFWSLDRFLGYEGSRRDDIQSVIYILIYLLKGKLPWTHLFQNVVSKLNLMNEERQRVNEGSISTEQTKQQTFKFKPSSREYNEKLYNQALVKLLIKVQQASVEQICLGVPNIFKKMLIACKQAQFQQKPNYNLYIRSLQRLLEQNGFENDGVYQWMVKTDKRLIMKKQEFTNLRLQLSNQKQILQNYYMPFQERVQLQ